MKAKTMSLTELKQSLAIVKAEQKAIEIKLYASLEKDFKYVKQDIEYAYSQRERDFDKFHLWHEWIYFVDPETMAYVKFLLKNMMTGEHSLFSTFCAILKAKKFKSLTKNFKQQSYE